MASVAIVVAMLYFAQSVLIPLALATLFAFLLAPVVTRYRGPNLRTGLERIVERAGLTP